MKMRTSLYLLLSALFILSLVSSVIWWTGQGIDSKRESDASRDDRINIVLRKLQTVQQRIQDNKRKQERNIELFISEKLPWLPKSNTVPNVLLRGQALNDVVVQGSEDDQPSLVFIHHPRTAGKHVINCLNNISYTLNVAMSPLMNSKNRILWDSGNSDVTTYQNKIQIHRGQFSFGMCEKINKSCSYFSMFRDPFDALVSHYEYCLSVTGSDICPPVDIIPKSLRHWILEYAGLIHSHFLLFPSLCLEESNSYSPEITALRHDTLWKRMPCLFKHHLLYKTFNTTEKTYITDFISGNLQNWFAAIGITSNVEDSFSTFENVFNYPFKKCNSPRIVSNVVSDSIESNRAYNENDRNRIIYEEDIVADELQSLRDDYTIQEALKLDYKIYNEARRIFNMQRQILFNKIDK